MNFDANSKALLAVNYDLGKEYFNNLLYRKKKIFSLQINDSYFLFYHKIIGIRFILN